MTSFCREHEYEIVHFICGRSGCVDSDVRSLNTTIVEGPTERHKSRLDSRETGDGLTGTGTYIRGSLDCTEITVCVEAGGESLDGTKPCAREPLTFPMPPFPLEADSFRIFNYWMFFCIVYFYSNIL